MLVLLGWFLPEWVGIAFLDPYLLAGYALMSISALSPLVCDWVGADAGQRHSAPRLHRHIGLGAAFGMLTSLLLVALRVTRVNVTIHPNVLLPDPVLLAGLLLISTALSLFAASLAAWLTVRVSPDGSKSRMRMGFFALLLAIVTWTQFASDAWRVRLGSVFSPFGMLLTGVILTFALTPAAWMLMAGAKRDPRYSSPLESR
jgi:uncharacterized membrane protein